MAAIPLMIPDLPPAEAIFPFLQRIDANRWYTNFGPLVREFEQALAEQVGGDIEGLATVTTANATVGLELALQALNLPRGARVLVPALTFVATATAIVRAGFEPVISDVDPDSWLLTPEIASAALAPTHHRLHIDAVMPVATFGCPQDVAAWHRWSLQHDVPVVIDAAGAFGNQPAGAVPVVFSLHATKSMGIGEGGFVACTDAAYLAQVRRLSNFGFGTNHGDLVEAGTNGKMSEYHAAVGLAALPHWRARKEIRLSLQEHYRQGLAHHCPRVVWQDKPEGILSILAVALPVGVDAGQAASRLARHGIETRRWYHPPLFDHPAFAACPTAGLLPVSRHLGSRILGLPFHLQLQPQDIATVCSELATAIEEEQQDTGMGLAHALRALEGSAARPAPARPLKAHAGGRKPRNFTRF